MIDNRKFYIGLVEDNKDPNRKRRIKVRVQGVFDSIDVDDIPYSSPVGSIDGKDFKVPPVGKLVNVIFPTGDIYDPYYFFSENLNVNLQNKLKDLSDDEYVNFVALLFDHRTQIYSDDNSLTLDYYFNKLTIMNNSINLELKDNNQKINLGTLNASQQAILGNRFFNWLDKFIEELLKPTSLNGNLSAPVLKPTIDKLLIEYKQIRKTFLSKNVYLNDNDQIEKLK